MQSKFAGVPIGHKTTIEQGTVQPPCNWSETKGNFVLYFWKDFQFNIFTTLNNQDDVSVFILLKIYECVQE